MFLIKSINREQILVEKTDGEITSFLEFYRMYYGLVRTVLFRCGIENDLEDVTHEVFLKAWNQIEGFEKRATIKSWLLKIAVNTAIDARRKRPPLVNLDDIDRLGDAKNSEQQQMTKELVQKALAALPVNSRVIVVLHMMEGYSLIEVADILDIPTGTVKSRLHKARQELEAKLIKLGA